jgi:ribosomal protein S18 acetylase RimI-like enzyme
LEREQAHTPERWQELLAGADTFLAVDGERILGTATGWRPDQDAIYLVAMYVLPEERGRRLAHLLIDQVRDAARAAGAARLLLEVAEANSAAARCYLAYGFRPTGRQHPMDRNPAIVEIEMELPLG